MTNLSDGYGPENIPPENLVPLKEAMDVEYSSIGELADARLRVAGPANEVVKKQSREAAAVMWAAGFGRKVPTVNWMELARL